MHEYIYMSSATLSLLRTVDLPLALTAHPSFIPIDQKTPWRRVHVLQCMRLLYPDLFFYNNSARPPKRCLRDFQFRTRQIGVVELR